PRRTVVGVYVELVAPVEHVELRLDPVGERDPRLLRLARVLVEPARRTARTTPDDRKQPVPVLADPAGHEPAHAAGRLVDHRVLRGIASEPVVPDLGLAAPL